MLVLLGYSLLQLVNLKIVNRAADELRREWWRELPFVHIHRTAIFDLRGLLNYINVQLRRDYRWILSQTPITRQSLCILTTGVHSDSPLLALAEYHDPSNPRAVFHGL